MKEQRNQIVVGILMTMVAAAPISLAATDDPPSSPKAIIVEMAETLVNLLGIGTSPKPSGAEENLPADDPGDSTDESGGMPDPYG